MKNRAIVIVYDGSEPSNEDCNTMVAHLLNSNVAVSGTVQVHIMDDADVAARLVPKTANLANNVEASEYEASCKFISRMYAQQIGKPVALTACIMHNMHNESSMKTSMRIKLEEAIRILGTHGMNPVIMHKYGLTGDDINAISIAYKNI